MLLTDMLKKNARENPNGTAFIFLDEKGEENRTVTHEEIFDWTETLSNRFLDADWQGRTAFLIFDHGVEFTLTFHACIRAGMTCVPLPPPDPGKLDFQTHYWRTLVQDTEADLIFSCGKACSLLASVIKEVSPENTVLLYDLYQIMEELPEGSHPSQARLSDRAALLYTSGSTSAPKGVSILHKHLAYNAQSCCESWAIHPDSVLTSWMPNHHSFGLIYNVLLPAFSGCTLVSLSTGAFIRNPRLWFEMIHRHKGTHGAAATFGYQLCSDRIHSTEDLDLSSWRTGLISAEPVRKGVCDQFLTKFESLGLPSTFFCALYGLSETGPITSMPVNAPSLFFQKPETPESLALACVGKQLPESRVLCVNPKTETVCNDGETGEIWVSGPSVMEGYFRREQTNQESFARLEGVQGLFFRTGDQGFIEDGHVYITGRIKEVIIVRGKNFYPQDIEWLGRECLPDVGPGSAAAFTSDEMEPVITLVIETPPSILGDETTGSAMAKTAGAFVAQKLGLVVGEIVLVPPGAIPKTPSGKIKRQACRQALEFGDIDVLYRERLSAKETVAQAPQPEVVDSTLGYIQQLFAQAMSMSTEEVDPSTPMGDYQLDSVAYLELAQAIEAQQKQTFHPANFFRFESIKELAGYLDGKKPL